MTAPKFRDTAIQRFQGARHNLELSLRAAPNGVMTRDQQENGDVQIQTMAKLVKTLEQHAKKKTMTEQFAKFEVEWKKAKAGKPNKVGHYIAKLGVTPFGEPPAPPKAAPAAKAAPARPGTPAPRR